MQFCCALLLGFVLQVAALAQTSPVLGLSLIRPKAGDEARYEAHLHKLAQVCATLPCPQRYLVLQPLTTTGEVWSRAAGRLNLDPQAFSNTSELWNLAVYPSLADEKKSRDWYWSEAPAVLRGYPGGIRVGLGGGDLSYRPELSHWTPWNMGEQPFLVITMMTRNPDVVSGAVFSGADGSYVIVSPAQTRTEADAIVGSAGPYAVVLAVRPDLSFPEKRWIVANPEFWAKPASDKDIRQLTAAEQMPQ